VTTLLGLPHTFRTWFKLVVKYLRESNKNDYVPLLDTAPSLWIFGLADFGFAVPNKMLSDFLRVASSSSLKVFQKRCRN
jgi:hypothetical protein